jgi:hypothetical protein
LRLFLVAVLAAPFIASCSSSNVPARGGVPVFDKTILDTAFRSEGVAVFDVDRDGHLDLVTDEYWYAGPAFLPHEIRAPQTYDPATGYSTCQAAFGDDVDRDGFTDLIVAPFPFDPANPPPEPMLWYQNPRGASDQHWTAHVLAPQGTAVEEHVEFNDGERVVRRVPLVEVARAP